MSFGTTKLLTFNGTDWIARDLLLRGNNGRCIESKQVYCRQEKNLPEVKAKKKKRMNSQSLLLTHNILHTTTTTFNFALLRANKFQEPKDISAHSPRFSRI